MHFVCQNKPAISERYFRFLTGQRIGLIIMITGPLSIRYHFMITHLTVDWCSNPLNVKK